MSRLRELRACPLNLMGGGHRPECSSDIAHQSMRSPFEAVALAAALAMAWATQVFTVVALAAATA